MSKEEIHKSVTHINSDKKLTNKDVKIINAIVRNVLIDELILSIKIEPSNLEHIAKTGKINGTLLVEIRRILNSHAQQESDKKAIEFKNWCDEYISTFISSDELEPKLKKTTEQLLEIFNKQPIINQ